MRIGVLGNCQAPGIGIALQQLLEKDEVFAIEAMATQRENRLAEAAAVMHGCELVFSHPLAESFGPLSFEALQRSHGDVRTIPSIAFTGFHPDSIFIQHGPNLLRSPLEVHHSAIAAAAFALGADVNTALRQFNADIFKKLGYFDEFAKARTYLMNVMSAANLDLSAEWPRWMARAPFMHIVNHPKAFALASIAKLLARREGLIAETVHYPEPVHDLLSVNPVWPEYPELAAVFGRKGSYLFKKNGGPDLVLGSSLFMTLPELVAGSFAMYATYPAEAFAVPAVERVRAVLQETL